MPVSSSAQGLWGLFRNNSTKQLGKWMVLLSLGLQGFVVVRLFQGKLHLFDEDYFHDDALVDPSPYTARRHALVSHNVNNNKNTTHGIQLDVMVPVFQRDERLVQFAIDLGTAIGEYRRKQKTISNYKNQNKQKHASIQTFRVLVTRFTRREKADSQKVQRLIAALTDLPIENIVMVNAPKDATFSRALALNLLHQSACYRKTCMVSRLDVDMAVKAEFFQHAVEVIILRQYPPIDKDYYSPTKQEITNMDPAEYNKYPPAYFPIVWSEYDPFPVKLVEEAYKRMGKIPLSKYSEHRGHWRHYGKGMYVLTGPDAKILQFNTTYQGWGLEDTDFYNRTVALPRRIVRRLEPGLVHVWHPKKCRMGLDIMTGDQLDRCKTAQSLQEGSKVGLDMLKLFWRGVDKQVVTKVVVPTTKEQQPPKASKRTHPKPSKGGDNNNNNADEAENDDMTSTPQGKW
ncbi:Chondroitin sulfate synthase 1 [Seminavis robusta]|uniref:Chondroitin sulfate synthase 1 n=1 Tax=Seminavis robusta TaxID=568900 RepID=A0A9N8HC61_9STRA|nr:Chondroitin sulfate synthase 1 [Seminavis robusta]|eukprot:Sro207_g086960.1 Chondroitin sulfate synthase 1 (457) ;mRNA; r:78164-79534